MADVTYLLGAGASAERIPVVFEMGSKITDVTQDFQVLINDRQMGSIFDIRTAGIKSDDKIYNVIPLIITDLLWMQANCRSHSSIDTFAKKLFLTNNSELRRLKIILSFYFTYLQIKHIPDKRYDNFWASIIKRQGTLPNKLKILSWNYDFQLEQSFMQMSSNQSLKAAKSAINLLHLNNHIDNFVDYGFGVLKLNGSAIFENIEFSEDYYLCDYVDNASFAVNLKQLVDRFSSLKNSTNLKTKLKFAWETQSNAIDEKLQRLTRNTEVLAIIGYSFPFFNREIDKIILSQMPNLDTIYIQDLKPEFIKERLLELLPDNFREDKIKLNSGTSQFVFPKELDIS